MEYRTIRRAVLIMVAAPTLCFSTLTLSEQNERQQIEALVEQACPTFWENPSSEIDLSHRTGDYWENDDQGRQAFTDYLSEMMATDPPTEDALNLMANDRLTVATECATQRVALMQFQMESMPNDLLIAMNSVGNGLGEAIGAAVGFSPENPAESCKDIKTRYPESVDGTYWINVQNDNPSESLEVFCEMTTDGGGWTMVAYVHRKVPENLFSRASGEVNLDRSNSTQSGSLGIVDELDDTEMVITIDTPDMLEAQKTKKFIQYRYAPSAPGFNTGPIPCTSSNFEYRVGSNSRYVPSGEWYCSAYNWYPKLNKKTFLAAFHKNPYGTFWGNGLGGNNSWHHSSWIYVR